MPVLRLMGPQAAQRPGDDRVPLRSRCGPARPGVQDAVDDFVNEVQFRGGAERGLGVRRSLVRDRLPAVAVEQRRLAVGDARRSLSRSSLEAHGLSSIGRTD